MRNDKLIPFEVVERAVAGELEYSQLQKWCSIA